MSRTRRFLGGLAFGYANQVLLTLAGLWLTAFLLGRLGQVDYGLWLVATQILSYLLLLDLGVVALLPRETAFATGRAGGSHRTSELPELVGHTVRVVLWQLPLVAIAAALIWWGLPDKWDGLRGPLAAVLVAFVATFPTRILQGTLEGLQDLAVLGATHTVSWLLSTSVTIALVLAGWGLYALAAGWVVMQLCSACIWWVRMRHRYRHVLPDRLPMLGWGGVKRRLGRGMWISLAQIAQVFVQGTDLLVIGWLLSPAAVVPYFCTAKIITVLANQPRMLSQTAQPALSELRASGERHRLLEVCRALTLAIFVMSGAIVCLVVMVNEGFVTWWVGADRFGGHGLTGALLVAMLLRLWNTSTVYAIFAFGYDRRISLTTVSDGLLTVVTALWLVSRFGITGAAVASIVGVTLISLPVNLSALAKETGTGLAGTVSFLWPWWWRFVLLAAASILIARTWVPVSLPALLLAGAGVAVIYGIVMLPLVLAPPLGVYVRPRLELVRSKLLGAQPRGAD